MANEPNMLEIFAIPYFAISGVLGWAIFQPFFKNVRYESLSPASITTTDLLATVFPICVVLSCSRWAIPVDGLTLAVQLIVLASALVYAAFALALGLFLLPAKTQVSFSKRMVVVALIAPFGLLLTIGWIGLLIWAAVYSMVYLAPTAVTIVASTIGLRTLGHWVCESDPTTVSSE